MKEPLSFYLAILFGALVILMLLLWTLHIKADQEHYRTEHGEKP